MIRHYFRAAIHHLTASKLFSALNIAGLAIGLAACTLIALYVDAETSYDEHWKDADRIFRVNTTLDATGSAPNRTTVGSFSVLPAMQRDFSEEIEAGARVLPSDAVARIGTSVFNEVIPQVDPELLEIFEFDTLAGDLEATLADPSRIALTPELAVKFFGSTDVLGRIVSLEDDSGTSDYRVTAIYRLPEGDTVLDLPAMRRLERNKYRYLASWLILSATTFIELAPGVDPADVNARLADFTDRNVDISGMMAGPGVKPSDRVGFDLQNITDAYLHSPDGRGGNPTMVFAFSVIAVLVLLIGCVNFTILTTARATQRAKEVAVRKVIGAERSQLVAQFLGESFVLVAVSTLVALAIVELVLPRFGTLVGRALEVPYSDPALYLALLVLLLVVGIASGLYPAFVLSHFRPAATLKANRSTERSGSVSPRNVLVVLQFSVSIALMVATATIYSQVRYTLNRDPGFDGQNLLIVSRLLNVVDPFSTGAPTASQATLKLRVAGLPDVERASLSMHQPTQTTGLSTIVVPYTLEGTSGAQRISTLGIDDDFLDTYRIPLIAGRNLAENRDRASRLYPSRSFVSNPEAARTGAANALINASAARQFGFTNADEAIGRRIRSGGSSFTGVEETLTIVGVIADTQFFSLRSVPRAEVYVLAPEFADVLTVRFRGDPGAMLTRIEDVWRSWAGDEVLSTSFVEQNLLETFAREQTEGRVLIDFALLAIVIACLGLFGSASFTVQRRTKEIGIRKVFGAEVGEIIGLLLWQFSRPVMVANLIAWPVALWALQYWLERFPYRIGSWMLGPICLGAGLLALGIAWLTVAGSSICAAVENPVKSLRCE